MTVKEILVDICRSYTLNTRAVEGATCVMLDSQGRRCAFSRYLNDFGRRILSNEGAFACVKLVKNPSYFKPGFLDVFLETTVHGYTGQFWQTIQSLHDQTENWNDYGVTQHGLQYIKEHFGIELDYQEIYM